MSIHGTGVDIVLVDRIHKIYSRRGNAFAARILSNDEYAIYIKKHDRVKYLSKCWAVKEAVVKAYGTGFTTPFSPCDIGYTSDGGKPYVRFSEKIHQSGLLNNKITHLSVSDELTHVIAFVIVENTKDK